MQPNGPEKTTMRRLYELASTFSVVSILLSACGFEVPPKATQTATNPTESPTPTPIPERFKKEGIGIIVEAGYAEAGRDFSVLSKYLESVGYTISSTQEQWSANRFQFQGKTVHVVEALAKTGEHLFIMTLAGAEKTEMITTVKDVVVDKDKDKNQTHEKMWTQQNFPMDEFLHLWGNVPKETQKQIFEEVFGKAAPGVPEEFQALRFASGHFMLLAYPDGNGGLVRDEEKRIVGFEGGSISFVGKDASGNPLFEAGQRKLIWMPFIRGDQPDEPKIMNALFATEKQPEISDKALAEQLSTVFGVKITGFERSDAGFFAMSDKERVLVFDGSWQFSSLHAWFTRDRIALKAGESTIPLLNNETRRYDQIIDVKTGEVFAKWNVEKGKWEVDEVARILALLPQELLKDPVLEKQFREILKNLDSIPTPGIENGTVVGGGSFLSSRKVNLATQILGVVTSGDASYVLVGDKKFPIVITLSLGKDGSTSYSNPNLAGGSLQLSQTQISEIKRHIGASVEIELVEAQGSLFIKAMADYSAYTSPSYSLPYYTLHLDNQTTDFNRLGINFPKFTSEGDVWKIWNKLDDIKKELFILRINPITVGFVNRQRADQFWRKNSNWQQLAYPPGVIPFDDLWYTKK